MLKKGILFLIVIGILCCSVIACGPSEEKVTQAQQKYVELREKHNQVVEAHSSVSDNSFDEQLLALRDKIAEVEAYNLKEMKDEEIDLLIQIMDSLIASYDEFHAALTKVKEREDAAVIVKIPVTVINNTGKAISSLKLYQQEDFSLQVNVLENLTPLKDGQTLTGLMIQRNVKNTPWVLAVEAEAGMEGELILPVEEYTESGITLTLAYEEESGELILTQEEAE